MTNLIHKNLFTNQFTTKLLSWNHKHNKRTMPWKGETDPYKIWLSEIILQQTRVEQGLKYYENFLFNFPDINKLATASEADVFKLWEGLGYYSRCRNLIATAKLVAQEGKFPDSYEDILRLKGVGPYTAAAIASFAFNLPHAVVDGNVFRVLSRVFGIKKPIDSTEGKKYFTNLANQLLDKKKPGEYNQAIMDFGATVCKPLVPLCETCVFKKDCVAFNTNRVSTLPVKEKRVQQKTRHFYFFVISYKNWVFVRERTDKDIWRHLHEFALIETLQSEETERVITTAIQNRWFQKESEVKSISETFTQKLTHQTIKGIFIKVQAEKRPALKGFKQIEKEELKKLAFPKMLNEYLGKKYL